MVVSLVLGIVLTGVGAVCVIAGVAVSVVETVRPQRQGAFGVADVVKIGKVVVEVLKAFGKLEPAGQLLSVGTALIGVGVWLLVARPF